MLDRCILMKGMVIVVSVLCRVMLVWVNVLGLNMIIVVWLLCV